MSVLIKGMEMPKACTKCLFFIESYSPSFPFVECKFIGRLGSVFNFIDDVPIDCPLEELPPHGRLIDADALTKSDSLVRKMMMFGGEYVYTQTEIDRTPTILEAEVKP